MEEYFNERQFHKAVDLFVKAEREKIKVEKEGGVHISTTCLNAFSNMEDLGRQIASRIQDELNSHIEELGQQIVSRIQGESEMKGKGVSACGSVVRDELRQLAELGQTPVACSMLLKGHSLAIRRLVRQLRASSDIYLYMSERTKKVFLVVESACKEFDELF